MFRVLPAPIIRSTIKTADAIIGTVHVSVWFKSVDRCPRSGVYFTMSWPNYGIFVMHLYNITLKTICTYSLSDNEHMMFETRRRHQEFNKNIQFKKCAFC
jgi:hypothetical protein